MSRKKIDKRIRKLIEHSISLRHRSMVFICGGKARKQVVYLHHLFLKCRSGANCGKASLLWCYKKEAELHIHRQNKKLKQMRKKYAGSNLFCKEDTFDHFLLSSDVQFCHYSQTDKVLGQTFSMLIIQDFEALTPNILARIVECVEGGGMILFLLPNITSLEELFTLDMDVHTRYATEAHCNITPRFNKRFVLSLISCPNCLVLDDSLKIRLLPKDFDICHESPQILTDSYPAIVEAVSELPATDVFLLCRTSDQLRSLQRLFESLRNRGSACTVSITSGRGRGKSALLGLAISLALSSGHSNIYVTSPHPENLQTLFTFVVKGFAALDFIEGVDYHILHSDVNSSSLITGFKVFRDHTKTVSYLPPIDFQKVGNADLVVIDEAAAIPLSLVKRWIGFCTAFLASTINGYEGTGRSLSLKLVNQLRNQSVSQVTGNKHLAASTDERHVLHEIQLNEAIRYSEGDHIEAWLNHVLCLEASIDTCVDRALPQPQQCQLYYVNRDVLFGYNPFAEKFLQQIVSLFVSSHYKNSPNDLLMMADAPAHHIFCLLDPESVGTGNGLPTVLCVIQISLEGQISRESSHFQQSHGRRASGDLIPWIISQQFQDKCFPTLSSARVVRIATHPDCQKMGYGQRALQLLSEFYRTSSTEVDLSLNPEEKRSPLLVRLEDVQQEPLDYLGVSYGLTAELFKFWKRAGFVPLYIRQTTSEVTGEHSCVMVKSLGPNQWLSDYCFDFLERFTNLLTTSFKSLPSSLALDVLRGKRPPRDIGSDPTQLLLTPRSLQRLNAYCQQEVDYHLVLDLLPLMGRLYYQGYLGDTFLTWVQESALVCVGLQNKSVDETSAELNTESSQVMGCFRKAVKKILHRLSDAGLRNSNDSKIVKDNNCGKRSSIINFEDIPVSKSKKFRNSAGSENSRIFERQQFM